MAIKTISGKRLISYATDLSIFLQDVNILKVMKAKPSGSKVIRKISIKADKEGKSRPFALLDYFSQEALRPLHDQLYAILRNIPQDATFDQGKAFKDVLNGQHEYYASFDLTAATDRFPIQVQEMVLSWLTSPEIASA